MAHALGNWGHLYVFWGCHVQQIMFYMAIIIVGVVVVVAAGWSFGQELNPKGVWVG